MCYNLFHTLCAYRDVWNKLVHVLIDYLAYGATMRQPLVLKEVYFFRTEPWTQGEKTGDLCLEYWQIPLIIRDIRKRKNRKLNK